MRTLAFKGVIPAMTTPFDEDETIDESVTEEMIEHLIANGVRAIMCCGSKGERAVLSREERKRFTELVVKRVTRMLLECSMPVLRSRIVDSVRCPTTQVL